MVGRTGPVSHNRVHHHLPVANTVEDHLATVELGFYRLRASEEPHALDGNLIHTLQAACDRGDYSIYRKYVEAVHSRDPIQLRDLLDFKPAGACLPGNSTGLHAPPLSLGAHPPTVLTAQALQMKLLRQKKRWTQLGM